MTTLNLINSYNEYNTQPAAQTQDDGAALFNISHYMMSISGESWQQWSDDMSQIKELWTPDLVADLKSKYPQIDVDKLDGEINSLSSMISAIQGWPSSSQMAAITSLAGTAGTDFQNAHKQIGG